MKKNIETVALIHIKDKKLLLVRPKSKKIFYMPGGKRDEGEDNLKALIREIKEEIGLISEIKKLIGVYRIDNDPRGVHLDIIYEGELNGEIKLSQEHQKSGLFNPDELPEKIAYKHKEAIEDWYKKGSQYD